MPENWKLHPVAELIGHCIEFYLHCDCTKLSVAKPGYLIDKLGPCVTVSDAERRMKCPTCKARPRIEITLEWQVGGGRDLRANPPALPKWVPLKLERAYGVQTHDRGFDSE